MTETVRERRIRLQAEIIRKRFEHATETIQGILETLTDEQLVEMEARHHKVRCETIAASATKQRAITLQDSISRKEGRV